MPETRHEFFVKRLKEIGAYDKDGPYGGMIGECVEGLSLLFETQRHSGGSAVETVKLFTGLMEEYINPC